jgi:hypothetical protein
VNLGSLIPLVIPVLILYGLHKWKHVDLWILAVAAAVGVTLTGTILGSDISTLMSQLSGGRLY